MKRGSWKMADSLMRRVASREFASIGRKTVPPLSPIARAAEVSHRHRGLTGVIAIADDADGVAYFRLMPNRVPVPATAEEFSKEPADSGFDVAEDLDDAESLSRNISALRRSVSKGQRNMLRTAFRTLRRDARASDLARVRSNRSLVKEAHKGGSHSWNVTTYSAPFDLQKGACDIRIEECACGAKRVVRNGVAETPIRNGRNPDKKRGRGRPRKDESTV